MKESFESYFKELKESGDNVKFVILFGSGFLKNDSCNESLLNNWDVLLKSIYPNFESSGNYILDFEKIILEHVSDLPAQKQENLLLKNIAIKIKDAEKIALDNYGSNYPSFIFNPNYVSDVISLNFDSVAEKLCVIVFKAKVKKRGYVKIDDKVGAGALLHQTTKFKILEFPDGKTITFWYPHGSVSKYSGMILGARKYGQHINCVERLRKHSKAEGRHNQKNDTWYDKLIHNPIMILGASISTNEWDIWSAFVNRERNFFKNKNNIYKKPIFQMRTLSSENKTKSNEKWFQPLFDEKLNFEEQWNRLDNLFKN